MNPVGNASSTPCAHADQISTRRAGIMTVVRHVVPTLMHQQFPLPEETPVGRFYPHEPRLTRYFDEEHQERHFEMLSFASFVTDTIEVEHRLVVPAVSAVRRLASPVTPALHRDLFTCVADEGFHAEQALRYRDALVARVDPAVGASMEEPVFIRRIEGMLAHVPTHHHALLQAIHGIVTETRISVELGTFARDASLCPSVRALCASHAEDEIFHSRLFQALALEIVATASDDGRAQFAVMFLASMVGRNLPDRRRLIVNFSIASGRSLVDAERIIGAAFDDETLWRAAATSAGPTMALARRLGLGDYVDLGSAFRPDAGLCGPTPDATLRVA